MNVPEKRPNGPIDNKILVDAVNELKAMGKDGFAHPSTKPVVLAAGVGAVAGWILPFINLPVGLIVGFCVMLYKRIRP